MRLLPGHGQGREVHEIKTEMPERMKRRAGIIGCASSINVQFCVCVCVVSAGFLFILFENNSMNLLSFFCLLVIFFFFLFSPPFSFSFFPSLGVEPAAYLYSAAAGRNDRRYSGSLRETIASIVHRLFSFPRLDQGGQKTINTISYRRYIDLMLSMSMRAGRPWTPSLGLQ